MRCDAVDDTINGVMEDNEDEADEIVDQVLDEIGIELGQSVRGVL
jgi:charged multivesicular body protein 2A